MAFDPGEITSRQDAIRSLCQDAKADKLSDTTIDLPPYSPRVTAYINERFTDYDTLPAASKIKIQSGYLYLTASELCRRHMKSAYLKEADEKSEYLKSKIDWDQEADDLQGQGEDLLDEVEEPAAVKKPGMLLCPPRCNPVTLRYQPIIGGD